jgi:galactokinase
MVEAARGQRGVLGARMVGAGFGGCTVNLVRREHVERAVQGMAEDYARQTDIRPEIYECSATGGAEVERC